MLTDSEREWLEKRGKRRIYCRYCGKDRICTDINSIGCLCPTEDVDFKDVAQFEARVAAKLTIMMYQLAANIMSRDFSCEKSCVAHVVCQKDKSCIHSFLKYARIAVEEEMEC